MTFNLLAWFSYIPVCARPLEQSIPLDTLRLSGVCAPTRLARGEEVWMKIVQATLSLTLAISGLLGVQILIDDKWLWAAAPSHAYGLIGFVSIDMILVVAALMRVGLATVSAEIGRAHV